jgi:hypothetical protein
MNELATIPEQTTELYRRATDVAGVCKDIVLKTAMSIQGRNYVKVEGWQSIATAHGCTASARDVQKVEGGVKAIGEIRRMSDGVVLATAEGFVGEDEPTWYGGILETKYGPKTLPKRPEYAIRAMCQTRAISRACRTAFAHVVVMMDAGLSTTPAEEVPDGGFQDTHEVVQPAKNTVSAPVRATPAPVQVPREPLDPAGAGWRQVTVPKFIKKYAGQTLGDMAEQDLLWWAGNYQPKPFKGAISQADTDFRAALDAAKAELSTPQVSGGNPSRNENLDEDVPF